MPGNTAAELLIRIGADPASAEASIRRFRTGFGRELSGLTSDIRRWSAQGVADFGRVERTAQTLTDRFRVNSNAVGALLDRNRQAAQHWRTDLVASFLDVLNTSEALSSSVGRSFLIFDSALGSNIASALIWQRSIGEAFRKAALQAVGAVAQESLVRAVYSTALGFYLLALQDYRGAALAFKSAALYGAVGGTAAVAGRALAATEVRESERFGSVRRAGAVGPELILSGPAEAPPQKTVQVIFQGPVYGGQAGIDELVRHISEAVTERDVNLTAYTVVRQPATRA